MLLRFGPSLCGVALSLRCLSHAPGSITAFLQNASSQAVDEVQLGRTDLTASSSGTAVFVSTFCSSVTATWPPAAAQLCKSNTSLLGSLADLAGTHLRGLGGSGRDLHSNARLNIKDIRSLHALLKLAEEGAARWPPSDLCAAFNHAVKLATCEADQALLPRTLDVLSAAYLPHVARLADPKLCTIPLWACGKAGYWEGGLAAPLVAALLARLGQGGELLKRATGQGHANLWWALSMGAPQYVVAAAAEPLRTSATSLLQMTAQQLNSQDCSNMLLACARLKHRHEPLLHHLTACLAEHPDPDCQALANSLYALGELAEDCGHVPNPHIIQLLAAAAAQAAQRMNGQGLANTLWALAVLGCSAPEYTDAVHRPRTGTVQSNPDKSAPQALSSTLCTLPEAVWPSVQALAAECRRRSFAGFTPQGISNTAWALAKMGYTNSSWYATVVKVAAMPAAMEGATPQNWSNLWYAIALVRHRPSDGLLQAMLSERQQHLNALSARANSQNCANLLWSLATLGLYEQRLDAVKRPESGTAPTALVKQVVGAFQKMQGPDSVSSCPKAEEGMHLGARDPRPQGSPAIMSVLPGHPVEGSCYRVHALVELAGGRRVAVEVDGPGHFLANPPHTRTKGGSTQLRDRQLERVFGAGNVMSVPYWEWEELKGGQQREEYLRRKLQQAAPAVL